MGDLRMADVCGLRVARTSDVVTAHDFSLGPWRPLATEAFLAEQRASLYAIDVRADEALFAIVGDPDRVHAQPFLYEAQRVHARALVRVPLARLLRWGDPHASAADPVLLFSTARSGSTLLVRALDRVDGLCGVSEPDAFTQLVEDRRFAADPRAPAIVRACAAWLFGASGRPPGRLVLKFRTQVLAGEAMLRGAWPRAPRIFCSRGLLPSVESYLQAFAADELDSRLVPPRLARLWLRARVRLDHLRFARRLWPPPGLPDPDELAALGAGYPAVAYWIAAKGWAARMRSQGLEMLTVDYDDLVAAPAPSMAGVLVHCGIDTSRVTATLGAFTEHSQRGSSVVAAPRPRPRLTADDEKRITAFFARHATRYRIAATEPTASCRS